MKNSSQSKFALFVMLGSLISVAALTFVFVQRGAAQDKEQQRPLRPIQRPVENNTVQEKQAAQIRELTADVAELKNQISALRQPLNELKACCEKQVSKADFEKQLFEVKLRLVNLEGVAKDYTTHTHKNEKLGILNNMVTVFGPTRVENLRFHLSGPVQP